MRQKPKTSLRRGNQGSIREWGSAKAMTPVLCDMISENTLSGFTTKPIQMFLSIRFFLALTQRLGKQTLFSFLLCLLASSTQAATWVLERADTPDLVTEEQTTEWETKAREGDWQLKMEFAAAYLYDTFFPNYGCKRLKYGHRCRAMAGRSEAGRIFLREVIDADPKETGDKVKIGSFQMFYAASLRAPAFSLEMGSEACRDKVHYYEQALQNGEYCVGRNLESMARIGLCMEKSDERAKAYRSQIPPRTGCPSY